MHMHMQLQILRVVSCHFQAKKQKKRFSDALWSDSCLLYTMILDNTFIHNTPTATKEYKRRTSPPGINLSQTLLHHYKRSTGPYPLAHKVLLFSQRTILPSAQTAPSGIYITLSPHEKEHIYLPMPKPQYPKANFRLALQISYQHYFQIRPSIPGFDRCQDPRAPGEETENPRQHDGLHCGGIGRRRHIGS